MLKMMRNRLSSQHQHDIERNPRISEEKAKRKHEKQFLKPIAPGRKRYAIPEPINATPDEVTQKLRSEKGYAKATRRQS